MAARPLEDCCSSGAQICCFELPAILPCLFKATINYSRCSKRCYHLAIRQISGAQWQRVAGFRGHLRAIFHATCRRPYDLSHFRELRSARSPNPAHRAANLTNRRFLSQRWNYKPKIGRKKIHVRQTISN